MLNLTQANLFNILLIYGTLVLYVIPKGLIPHTKIFIPIFSGILLAFIVLGKIKLYRFDVVLAILILLLGIVFNFNLARLADSIYIIFLLFTCYQQRELGELRKRFLYFISLISIAFQLLIYRAHDIPVLSYEQVNLSAALILLWFFFCHKNNFRVGMLFALCLSLVFLSRAYILSLLIFMIFLGYEKLFQKYSLLLSNTKRYFIFFAILLILNLSVLGIGNYFINYISIDNTGGRSDSLSRIIQLNDRSNLKRFTANDQLIENLFENKNTLFFGMKKREEEDFLEFLNFNTTVHNSFLIMVATRGVIFSIVYFFIISIIIKRLGIKNNIKYIMSYFCFSLFLHSLFQGASLVYFIAILSLPERKSNDQLKINWKNIKIVKI